MAIQETVVSEGGKVMVPRYDRVSHLVIIGAGATCASFPSGDYRGRSIPAMNGFLEKTGILNKFPELTELVTEHPNLEDLYSELSQDPKYQDILERLDLAIREYMASLHCGSPINLYDKLMLSLTSRDYIATFNWDPFLAQSYYYMSYITKDLPHIIYLHGNVAIGYCENCHITGYMWDKCQNCKEQFTPVPLLYPVKEKNYEQTPYIKGSWDALKTVINNSFMITFWGYSAPKSDTAALNIMHESFNNSETKNYKQIEIINIAEKSLLEEAYEGFIYKPTRISFVESFYQSAIANNPRRSCDCLIENTMHCNPSAVVDENENRITIQEEDDLLSIIRKMKQIEGEDVFRYCYKQNPITYKEALVNKFGRNLKGIME